MNNHPVPKVSTYTVTQYYDTKYANTVTKCVLTVDEDSQTLIVSKGGGTMQEVNIADIVNVISGKNSGFLCIWLKEAVIGSKLPEPHQILLDITPNKDVTCVVRILREMRGWEPLASVYGAKYDFVAKLPPMLIVGSRAEKEELLTNFIRSLKARSDTNAASPEFSHGETCPGTESDADEGATDDLPRDHKNKNGFGQVTPGSVISQNEATSQSNFKEAAPKDKIQRREPVSSKKAHNSNSEIMVHEDVVKSFNDAVTSLSHQPTKRRRLDELDSSFSQVLEGVETLKIWLMRGCSSNKSEIALIDRLESENERLHAEIDKSKQQASLSSEFQGKLEQLALEHAALKKDYDEVRASVTLRTSRNAKLSRENRALAESLKEAENRLTTHLDSARRTLSIEMNNLRETLAVVELENDALKGLTEMFVSGVNITELLVQVKGGTGFDEALRASMRSRSQA